MKDYYDYNNYNEYEYDNNNNKNNKKNHHVAAKTIAGILAAAIVSAGSIGIYSYATKDNSQSISTAQETESQTSENTTSSGAISLSNTKTNGNLTTSQIAKKVLPSVVGIESKFNVQNANTQQNIFGNFFGNSDGSSEGQSSEMTATGTGVIYTSDGYIVTNAHVIYDSEYNSGKAAKVTVLMNDDKNTKYDAAIVAYDVDADLAVLKIKATGLTAAEFGDSSKLSVGDSVVAIGNPLGLDLTNTVTSGIISGLNRNITINDKTMTLIQTDAAINSGNSGGPLIDSDGKVIGINSSKMSSSYSSNSASIEGIGFAIPANTVVETINDLIKYGYVTGKPQLGITAQDVSESVSEAYNIPQGVYVVSVNSGSAAEKAGLQKGDVITAVNGKTVKSYEELAAIKNNYKAGETITLTIWESGSTKDIKLTLDEAKSNGNQEESTSETANQNNNSFYGFGNGEKS